MARVYDENGKIIGTTESQDIRLNQSNELYKGENLDEVLKELAKVFTIEEQLKIMQILLGYNEKEGEQQTLDRTLLIQDLDMWEETLFALKNSDGTFNITMDDITVLGDATVTFDETAGTLKVVSTSTSGYQGIRINKSIPYNNKKEAFLCVVTLKNNLNNSVSVGEIYTNKDYFMDIDSNGFSRYEYAIQYGISQIPIYAPYNAIDVEVENIKYIRIGRLASCYDIHDLDKKIANMNLDGLDGYAPLASPVFTGSISLGRDADITAGTNSFAVGTNLIASGANSHAEGYGSSAYGGSSHAEGVSNTALGYGSHAEGNYTTSSGSSSHAEGYYTKASGNYSHSEGKNTTALGDKSHAEGYSTNTAGSKVDNLSASTANDTIITAFKNMSSITGEAFSLAKGDSSHVEGKDNLALYYFSHAEGNLTISSSNASHAEGINTTASGDASHAEGKGTTADGLYSHAEGEKTTALGKDSHAEGFSIKKATDVISNLSTSTSNDDIIEAWNTFDTDGMQNMFTLAKDYSHAEGANTLALGRGSHAEGAGTKASGNGSHAEGDTTTASGSYSHAEGNSTASGHYSHAEGVGTKASGNYSHAEGNNTIASSENQHVQGKYNIEDTENKYAHIVGNGKYNDSDNTETRSNAHTLDWEGNAWYKGELYTGGTSQADGNKVLTTADISFNEAGELVVTIGGVSKTFVPKSE